MAVISAFVAAVTTAFTAASGYLAASSIGAFLVRTVITGLVSLALNRVLAPSQKKTGADPGARFQLSPQTNHKIPVLYGTAYFGGIIVDGRLVNNNKQMQMVMVLSETTGAKLSNGSASAYSVGNVLLNTSTVTFKSDGITVDKVTDRDGNDDTSMRGLMRVYIYAGGLASARQLQPPGTTITAVNGWTLVDGWDSTYQMQDLITAIVVVDYNRDKNVTSVGDWQFQITNSMTLPGDVMFDYMTNTRYGAGIPLTDIAASDETQAQLVARLGLDTYPWINLE
jgi:hypothetical protein